MARVIRSVTKRYYLAMFSCEFIARQSYPRIGNHDDRTPAFIIVKELSGPEIPCDMRGMGDYFVLEVVRKFRVTAHAHETTFSTEEIK